MRFLLDPKICLGKTKRAGVVPIEKTRQSLRRTRFVLGRSIDFLSNLLLIIPAKIVEALNGLTVSRLDFLEETREMVPRGNLDQISVDSMPFLNRRVRRSNHFAIKIRRLNHNGETKRIFADGRSTSFAH